MIRDMNVKAAYDVNIESPWEISVFFKKNMILVHIMMGNVR